MPRLENFSKTLSLSRLSERPDGRLVYRTKQLRGAKVDTYDATEHDRLMAGFELGALDSDGARIVAHPQSGFTIRLPFSPDPVEISAADRITFPLEFVVGSDLATCQVGFSFHPIDEVRRRVALQSTRPAPHDVPLYVSVLARELAAAFDQIDLRTPAAHLMRERGVDDAAECYGRDRYRGWAGKYVVLARADVGFMAIGARFTPSTKWPLDESANQFMEAVNAGVRWTATGHR